MMKRNYLWMLLASMAFVGCSQNDDLPEGNENQNGEKEVSYIAINVNATPSVGSRAAADGGFSYGTVDENKVKDAYFFFFDAQGNAFSVSGYVPTNNSVTDDNDATTGGVNWVKYTFSDSGNSTTGTTNTERQLAAVLTLQKITNSYPASVVAILGWTPSSEQNKSYSLAELKAELLTSHKSDEYFIMSNSVYNDGTANVYATALTPSNFATTENSAEASPVEIYVERVAAKVTVKVDGTKDVENNDNIFAVKTADATPVDFTITLSGESTPKQVYAKILGWDINTTINKSYLLKNIENNTGFYSGWNDATNYRSYWANNPTDGVTYDTSFKLSEFNELNNSDSCLENAIGAAPVSGNDDNRTNVIVKAQLGTLDATTFTGLSIAQWMGTYYAFDDLKGAVATALSNQLYYSTDGTIWTAINTKVGDEVPGLAYIGLVRGDGQNPDEGADYYKAFFTYEAPTSGTIYWSFDGTTALTQTGSATVAQQVTAKLNALAPAKVWTNGTAYYYLPIEHLDSQYGVIRNHAYDIVINGVTGLGTPVYLTSDNEDPEIPNPDKPEETETYLAARINVLSWKLITNNVTLQ